MQRDFCPDPGGRLNRRAAESVQVNSRAEVSLDARKGSAMKRLILTAAAALMLAGWAGSAFAGGRVYIYTSGGRHYDRGYRTHYYSTYYYPRRYYYYSSSPRYYRRYYRPATIYYYRSYPCYGYWGPTVYYYYGY
jgi:hypothetical protein